MAESGLGVGFLARQSLPSCRYNSQLVNSPLPRELVTADLWLSCPGNQWSMPRRLQAGICRSCMHFNPFSLEPGGGGFTSFEMASVPRGFGSRTHAALQCNLLPPQVFGGYAQRPAERRTEDSWHTEYQIWETLGEKNAEGIPQDFFQGKAPNLLSTIASGWGLRSRRFWAMVGRIIIAAPTVRLDGPKPEVAR